MKTYNFLRWQLLTYASPSRSPSYASEDRGGGVINPVGVGRLQQLLHTIIVSLRDELQESNQTDDAKYGRSAWWIWDTANVCGSAPALKAGRLIFISNTTA